MTYDINTKTRIFVLLLDSDWVLLLLYECLVTVLLSNYNSCVDKKKLPAGSFGLPRPCSAVPRPPRRAAPCRAAHCAPRHAPFSLRLFVWRVVLQPVVQSQSSSRQAVERLPLEPPPMLACLLCCCPCCAAARAQHRNTSAKWLLRASATTCRMAASPGALSVSCVSARRQSQAQQPSW